MDIFDELGKHEERLCIGLDPGVILDKKIDYCKSIIDKTHEFTIAYKPNIQFLHGLPRSSVKDLCDYIHDLGKPVIADLKISDIGNTNRAGLENMYESGFDYVTHSPFPGNIEETAMIAKDIGIGIFTLVVMSNPQAKWMIESKMYKIWAKDVSKYCEGAVIGTTNHVTDQIIQELASILKHQIILAPGIGSQGGEISNLKNHFDNNVIFNVSRGISISDDPKLAAKSFHEMILNS